METCLRLKYCMFRESAEKKVYDKIRAAESASRGPAQSLAEIACDRASVILRRSMEIVYFANTPPTAASCQRTIILVSVSPRFRLQLGLLVHLGRRFDAQT